MNSEFSKKQPDDKSSDTINIDSSQVGVAGKDVHVNGGIHYHYYQPQTPPAAPSEPRKDTGDKKIITGDEKIKVFISYAREDIQIARRLYDDLKLAEIILWMDKADLLPGQNWKFHITKAIRESSYFIALLSSKALSKRGFVQKELKLALDILDEFSDEDVFLIPARLDDCEPADEKLKFLHWADLFPSYEAGRDEIFRVFQVPESEKTGDDETDAVIQPVTEPEKKPPEKDNDRAVIVKERQTEKKEATETSETEKEFINSLSMKFVYIKPGTFMMGSPENEPGRYDTETLHQVTLTSVFYMQTTEVTAGHWRTFVKDTGFRTEAETGDGAYGWTGSEWKKDKKYYWDNPGFEQTDSHPVTCVSWNDVQAFIKWLNQKESDKYRLPTEAEWEYAARAGSDTAYCFGNDAGKLKDYAWYGDNSGGKTHPVAQLKPNAWGLYDMHGNVWEWVQDSCEWGPKPDTYKDGIVDPINTLGSHRVDRGGGWYGNARNCRSAFRINGSPDFRHHDLGFRLLSAAP